MNNTIPVELHAQPEQYKMLGMKPGTPEVWEDSLRTSGAQGEYEWWYFDSKLEGGGNLVIVFYTISPTDNQNGGFAPLCPAESYAARWHGTQGSPRPGRG